MNCGFPPSGCLDWSSFSSCPCSSNLLFALLFYVFYFNHKFTEVFNAKDAKNTSCSARYIMNRNESEVDIQKKLVTCFLMIRGLFFFLIFFLSLRTAARTNQRFSNLYFFGNNRFSTTRTLSNLTTHDKTFFLLSNGQKLIKNVINFLYYNLFYYTFCMTTIVHTI